MYTQADFQIFGRPGPDRRSIRYSLARDDHFHVAARMRPGHAPGLFGRGLPDFRDEASRMRCVTASIALMTHGAPALVRFPCMPAKALLRKALRLAWGKVARSLL